VIVGLPHFVRDYLDVLVPYLLAFLLAISSMVYFSRFAREAYSTGLFFYALMVVSIAQGVRDRKMRWLVLVLLHSPRLCNSLKRTFLTIADLWSFLGSVSSLGTGKRWPLRAHVSADASMEKLHTRDGRDLSQLRFTLSSFTNSLRWGWSTSEALELIQFQSPDSYIQRLPTCSAKNLKVSDTSSW